MQSVPVLITRPEHQAEEFAQALVAALGVKVDPVVAPLVEIKTLPFEFPKAPIKHAIFTSVNAVRAAVDNLPTTTPVSVVGDQSKNLLEAAGFERVTSYLDVEKMMIHIPAGATYFRGKSVRHDLGAVAEGLKEILVYEQKRAVVPDALTNATAPVIVPIFSLFAAEALKLAKPRIEDLSIVAISPIVAEALGPNCRVSEKPTRNAMIDAIEAAANDFLS